MGGREGGAGRWVEGRAVAVGKGVRGGRGGVAAADVSAPFGLETSYVKCIIFLLILLHLLPRVTDGFRASVFIATLPPG